MRLAGIDSTPEDADPGRTHPAERPQRGAQTEQSMFRYGGEGENREI